MHFYGAACSTWVLTLTNVLIWLTNLFIFVNLDLTSHTYCYSPSCRSRTAVAPLERLKILLQVKYNLIACFFSLYWIFLPKESSISSRPACHTSFECWSTKSYILVCNSVFFPTHKKVLGFKTSYLPSFFILYPPQEFFISAQCLDGGSI